MKISFVRTVTALVDAASWLDIQMGKVVEGGTFILYVHKPEDRHSKWRKALGPIVAVARQHAGKSIVLLAKTTDGRPSPPDERAETMCALLSGETGLVDGVENLLIAPAVIAEGRRFEWIHSQYNRYFAHRFVAETPQRIQDMTAEEDEG